MLRRSETKHVRPGLEGKQKWGISVSEEKTEAESRRESRSLSLASSRGDTTEGAQEVVRSVVLLVRDSAAYASSGPKAAYGDRWKHMYYVGPGHGIGGA